MHGEPGMASKFAFAPMMALLTTMLTCLMHTCGASMKAKGWNNEAVPQGYASAKAGMLGLTRAQAVSLYKRVRVNSVLPGWIVTPGSQARVTQDLHDWHLTGRSNQSIPKCLLLFRDACFRKHVMLLHECVQCKWGTAPITPIMCWNSILFADASGSALDMDTYDVHDVCDPGRTIQRL